MKKIPFLVLVLAITLGAAGCNLVDSAKSSISNFTSDNIRIGILPDVQSVPFLIAESQGYFDEAGVKVKLVQFKSAQDRDSALQSNRLDGVVTDLVAVFFANEGGIPLQAVAKTDGDFYLLAGEQSGVKSIKDVVGKSIGLSSNTIMEFTVDTMLSRSEIPLDQVEKVIIPPIPTRLEMLQGGKIDLAILPEPLSQLAAEQGATAVRSTKNSNIKAGVIAFNSEVIQEKPDDIKAVFDAYNKAAEYLNTIESTDYIELVITQMGFPVELKEVMILPTYTPAEPPSKTIFILVKNWMKEKELIANDYTYEDIVAQDVLP